MTRRIREEEWVPEGVAAADLFAGTPKPVSPALLTCKDCATDIDLYALFVRDGVCADCEWGGA